MMDGASNPQLLLLMTAMGIGGTEMMGVTLAKALEDRDWSVRTVFSPLPDNDALLAWFREQGARAEISPALPSRYSYRYRDIPALRRLVRESHPDVVNIHYGGNHLSLKDLIAVRLAGRQPCVVTINHARPWTREDSHRRRMTYLAAHLADAVVVISRATRETVLQAGIPARKVHVVPCGIPVPDHLPGRGDARARLGLPPQAFVVGCLARLVPHKGIEDLIEAAARVPDPSRELVLLIAGDGPDRASLGALAEARLPGRTVFAGRVPDTADVYAACDVFALPSYEEGFGLVYVEAAFHGVPSIGTTVGGVPDAIADGQTGLLVQPGDSASLSAAIQRLRGDSSFRLRLGEAARIRAHSEFSTKALADRYAAVFRHVGVRDTR